MMTTIDVVGQMVWNGLVELQVTYVGGAGEGLSVYVCRYTFVLCQCSSTPVRAVWKNELITFTTPA